jgi:ubiquinone/menaquinone biosynthesis C-methylase UbiE
MSKYLEHTREAFNSIAPAFDKSDKANPILLWMRSVVYKIYLQNIPAGSNVLELNAGTGIDAMFLASNGIKVFATDISDKMISILKTNAAHQIEEGTIQAKLCPFSEIGSIESTGFDAAVSNFGGLNCINDFTQLSQDLYAKLKPGGKFIAVVMNDFCPWEIFYYMLKFDSKNAFRRFNREGIDAALDDQKVKTFYFSPKRFAKDFQNQFEIEKIYAHALYTPSPYLLGIYKRIKPIVKIWMKIDEIVKGIFPFNRFGDHFIIILRKK